jgi:hypothetical protein
MKRIEVKLSLPVVAPLLDIIKGLAGDLKIAPAVESAPIDTDGELRAAWAGELIAGQSQDLGVLLALFGDEFFADGVVRFDGNNADAIARACSAVRLRLRERYLKGVADESLEAGEVDIGKLAEPVRKAFMCYLFLATIQELIIQHLDESIVG